MNMRAETTRVADARPAATATLTALGVVTVVALCRVFSDWAYLRPMLVLVLGVHAVLFVLRAARAPLYVALPVVAVTAFVLLGIIYYRDTLTALLPTGRTVDLFRVDLRVVLDQFPTAVPPVPSQSSFAPCIAVLVAAAAVLGDTFAFRAMGRIEAVVPTGVIFVFASALGSNRHRVLVAALWIGTALFAVAVLRFSQHDRESGWMGARRVTLAAALPALVLPIAVSAVAAFAVAPRLPGAGERAILSVKNHKGDVTEVLSPIVSLRAEMTEQGKSELFSVKPSDNKQHYWRVTGLPDFDGVEWSPIEEDLRRMGNRTDEVPRSGATISQEITVKAMGGVWLPAAYHPVTVNSGSVQWAGESQSLLKSDKVRRGDVYVVESVIVTPSIQDLRAATVSGADDRYYKAPPGMPDVAKRIAQEITSTSPTPYDRAMALQDYFRNNFQYDLNVQIGSSNDAIATFLRNKRGFCQQFAGTFAVMARYLGLPARVAVGYTAGDLGKDGRYHVFGRHAHAWPEVWFDGIGWVAFEPTSQRGNPDATGYTGVTPQQAGENEGGTTGNGNQGTTTTSTIAGGPTSTVPRTTVPGGGQGNNPTTTEQGDIPGINRSAGSWTAPVALFTILLLVVLWVLLSPRFIAAAQRRRLRTPHERIVAAWYRACHSLSLAGAPPMGGATPLEYAPRAERLTGVLDGSFRELAQVITETVYGRVEPDDLIARRCEALEHAVERQCRDTTPWSLRLQSVFDPRMLRKRVTG